MLHNFPIGISEFKEIREEGSFYVDKTRLISDLIGDRSKVVLFPRPRRFGKTLNLTMLRTFFDDASDHRHLFDGLAVSADPAAMAQLGAFPTLYFTFKDLKAQNWDICQQRLLGLIGAMFDDHWPRIERSDLPSHQKDAVYRIITGQASLATCTDGLGLLTKILHRISGKRVILLIDEYDSPIHAGHLNGYRSDIVAFMRDFLSSGLKDNPYLEKGVLTGILRVAKDSIFSGLNNLQVYSILDKPYAAHFGFTEPEVRQMLEESELADREAEVQRWYNGYRFGDQTVYNPWSILCFLKDPESKFVPHWINTAGNEIIRDLVVQERAISLEELTKLLADGSVEQTVNPYVALNQLNAASVWGLLLFSGYLTISQAVVADQHTCNLRIPNREVRSFFESTLAHWLGEPRHVNQLMASLLSEDMTRFSALLGTTVTQVLSYHDTGGTDSERVYHVFMLGLLVHLRDSYQVLSNQESGYGRYDLALVPKDPGKTGFIFELKRGQASELPELAQSALAQLEAKDYAAALRDRGITRIRQIGLAFSGKQIHLASSIASKETT